MKKSKCLLVALMVLCLFFGITSISFAGVCFVTDVECIADIVLPFDQYDSEPTSKKEWSAVRGYIVAENNYISFNFMFDQESINTLKHKVSSIFGGFGLEVEIVEKDGHLLDLDFITNNLPASSNPQRDTNVCDYTTNTGASDHVNALLIRNPENLQKDVWYEVCFVFKNNIPSSGVEIQPNLVIALDMDDLTYLYPDSIYKYLIRLLIEELNFLDQFEYYTLETDCYLKFTAYPNGSGVYWKQNDSKTSSHVCESKSCLISAVEAVNNEANGIIPALFASANLKPVKFAGESTVYLVSNNSLCPMLNDKIFALLGFRYNCSSLTPNWGNVIELNTFEKVFYESRIKKSILPSQNNYSSGDLIAYQVIPKVGPVSCASMEVNSNTICLFGDDNKFHPIQNEQVYFDLGYKYDWSDVVEISQELFDYYGEGDVVYGYDNNLGNLCSAEIPSTLIFMSSVQQSELVLEPLPETDDNINITSSNDYTINRSTICKDADMDYPYLPINEITSFTINNSSETSVHAWIQLDNISKRIRVDWYWYDADGRKVESDYAFLGKDGSLYGWWRDFCNCSVYNTKSFGKWKVQIYIEEELAIIDYFYVSVNLAIPQNLNLSYNKELKQVNLTWNQVEFAEKYHIYRNGNMIQETNNLYHTDTEVVLGNSYTYKVLAIRGNRTSSFSDGVNINIPKEELLIPVIIEISVQ